MSAECQLYGKISGAHGSTLNWWELYPLNCKVIEKLPDQDTYPPLIRDMFKCPTPPFNRNNPILYRNQIIHFGASFNHFNTGYEDWLIKFEALLKQMYWYKAIVHLEMEMFGNFEFKWEASSNSIIKFGLEKPEPVTDWKFERVIKN